MCPGTIKGAFSKEKTPEFAGAGDGIWTRDFNLGKVALYHWVTPAWREEIYRWFTRSCQQKKRGSGDFYIEDNDVKRKMEAEDVGYVLSTPNVPEFLTAREFLKFFIDIYKNK